jgi:hypothetical protein
MKAGLCDSCIYKSVVPNERGSHFIFCLLSKKDPAFPKYPALPVLECEGYTMKDDSAPL